MTRPHNDRLDGRPALHRRRDGSEPQSTRLSRRGRRRHRHRHLAQPRGPAAFAAPSAAGSATAHDGGRPGDYLIPQNRRGIILFTVRDAVSRDPLTTDAPSGFLEVFQYLSALGYAQIEFAGYGQHANAVGGANPGPTDPTAYLAYARTLRGFLDDNGLKADGNHGFIPATWPPTMTPEDSARSAWLEFASILGMPHMGTGGDPRAQLQGRLGRRRRQVERAGRDRRSYGIKLYTHNHDAAYDFLLDSGPYDSAGLPTRSSGVRKLEYFLKVTDPRYVWLQMDIFWAHVAQHRFRTYTAPNGQTRTDIFDPAALVAANTRRFPLFHAKDGLRTDEPPGVGAGYVMVPFGESGEPSLGTPERGINFTRFIRRIGSPQLHYMNYEQDNAPGPAGTGVFQSLLYAAVSYRNMSRLTG